MGSPSPLVRPRRCRQPPPADGLLQPGATPDPEALQPRTRTWGKKTKVPVVQPVSQSVLPSNTGYFRLRRARSPPLTELASESSQLAAAHSPYVGTSIRDIFPRKTLCFRAAPFTAGWSFGGETRSAVDGEENPVKSHALKHKLDSFCDARSCLPHSATLDKMAMLYPDRAAWWVAALRKEVYVRRVCESLLMLPSRLWEKKGT